MKAWGCAISLALILALMTPAPPLSAQAQTEAPKSFDFRGPAPMTGPLARAAIRETIRLAATTPEPEVPPIESIQQGRQSGPSDWSRVRDLAPGTELIVIVTGVPPATRYLIAQSESALTVLNVTGATLPFAARDELRDVVSRHPEYIAATQQGRTFVLGKNVRLEPDGVFVADRKVADLTEVIENIPRSDVVEINTTRRERGWLGCGFVGYAGWWLGGMAGGMTGGFVGWEVSKTDGGALGGMVLGALAGGITGGVWSYRKCRHKPEEVIYRAS